MQRIRLTAERIRKFTCPVEKQQAFLTDTESPGLKVRVTAGAKSFIFEAKLNRQTIRMTIGDVRSWTLEDARTEANRLQTLVDKNEDPREIERQKETERSAKKAAEAEAAAEAERRKKYTLRALCDAYIEWLEARGKRSAIDARSLFRCHVYQNSAIADRPACDIKSLDLATLVRTCHEAGKERAAGKVRSYLHAAYEMAIRAPLDAALPASLIPFNVEVNPARAIPVIPVKSRTRTLSVAELKQYMGMLGDDMADRALRLALLSGGQRMRQLLRATVADWNGEHLRLFDRKGKRQIPREHILPLAPKGIAIADDLASRANKMKSKYLFASAEDVTISEFTISKRVKAICTAMKCEPFDLRDIRRTCETMLAGMGISRDMRAQLLSHGISGVQAVHYDRHDYLSEKAVALVAWEKRLDEIVSGKKSGNVVRLGRKKAKRA